MGRISMLLLGSTVLAGCLASERDLLFPAAVEGVPAIVHLGELTPLVLNTEIPADENAALPVVAANRETVANGTIYHELGPTGTTEFGGSTFNFKGTGGNVCVWVDPELLSWSQSVQPNGGNPNFEYPDNIYDDGDIDLQGGLSVYYSGNPGDVIGSFSVDYRDALGNVVPIDLVECFILSERLGASASVTPSHAGRGSPEYCTIENTIAGVDYTMLLETYSTPIDDRRLGYGLVVTEGTCDELIAVTATAAAAEELDNIECLIVGEAINPGEDQGPLAAEAELPAPSWLGASEVPSWKDSRDFEAAFCAGNLKEYCEVERREMRLGQRTCAWEVPIDPEAEEPLDRCYCGDLLDTPGAGAN